jgi:predicted outer membrane repeat protein
VRFFKFIPSTILILAVCGQLTGCGSKDPVEPEDTSAPITVTNLMVFSNTSSSVTLRWTAPSDKHGSVVAYDIRYSQTALTDENWGGATEPSSIPSPGAPGSRDECVISGLTTVDSYYFGLKTRDDAGNWSELSNVVSVTDPRTYVVCVDGSNDFTEIQDAIFATRDGDTVEVCDGTYQGEGNRGIEYFGKAITVRSQSGDPENCIIDCEGLANGFLFRDEEGPTSVLTGVKVINGDGEFGGAVYCGVPSVGVSQGASPTIENCVFADSPANQGAGIYCDWRGSNPQITNCSFIGNSSGSGIYTREDVEITIADCVFDGNMYGAYVGKFNVINFVDCTFRNHTDRAVRGGETSITTTGCTFENNVGGAFHCHMMTAVLTDCVFVNNTAQEGGALHGNYDANYTVNNCRFLNNSATEEGGAVFCEEFVRLEMTDCWFEGNTAAEGGAVYIRTPWGYDPTFTSCTFFNNSSSGPGGVLRLVAEGIVRFENTTFVENSAQYGAVAYGSGAGSPQILLSRCIVANGQGGGTISCQSPATATLNCTDVYGNVGGNWYGCLNGQEGSNGNISADPLFCGAIGSGDLTIRSNSPCATAGCGFMGAHEVGCSP